jgi:hypothetical protein
VTLLIAVLLGWPAVALAVAIGIGRAIHHADTGPRCPDTVPAWMTAEVGA